LAALYTQNFEKFRDDTIGGSMSLSLVIGGGVADGIHTTQYSRQATSRRFNFMNFTGLKIKDIWHLLNLLLE